MDASEIAMLRTMLRGVNIRYSALIRTRRGDDWDAKIAQLQRERRALMALITGTTTLAPKEHFQPDMHIRPLRSARSREVVRIP